MKTHQIKLSGKVQGVYFRASAKQQAMNLGVSGYIKNESDGTVSLQVEGEEAAVNKMVDWCKKGPGLARVADIQVSEQPTQNYKNFEIKK